MGANKPTATVATQLQHALQGALSTLDGAADGTILPEQVSEHLMLWETTFESYKPYLPERAWHLGRSVRMALGEALGGVVLSSVDIQMVGYQLAEHDEQWNETGRRYLMYCLEWLDWWSTTGPTSILRRRRLLAFDPWLAARSS